MVLELFDSVFIAILYFSFWLIIILQLEMDLYITMYRAIAEVMIVLGITMILFLPEIYGDWIITIGVSFIIVGLFVVTKHIVQDIKMILENVIS